MSEKVFPKQYEPVLARISYTSDIFLEEWYEVVFHDGNNWCSYAGSVTFEDGEIVKNWVYAERCFHETDS